MSDKKIAAADCYLAMLEAWKEAGEDAEVFCDSLRTLLLERYGDGSGKSDRVELGVAALRAAITE